MNISIFRLPIVVAGGLILALPPFSSSRADDTPKRGGSFVVENGFRGDFQVLADSNNLILKGPSDTNIILSEAFDTPTTDWRPVGEVKCSWSPDGHFLAIFIPHPRATEVSVVDLKNGRVLDEFFPSINEYPSWYDDVFATQDYPVKWDSGKLEILTKVLLRNGGKKDLRRFLSIEGIKFGISPERTHD